MTAPDSLSSTVNRLRAAASQPTRQHHLNTWYVGLNNLFQASVGGPLPLCITIRISLSSSGEDLGALRDPGSDTATTHILALSQSHTHTYTHTYTHAYTYGHILVVLLFHNNVRGREEKKQARPNNESNLNGLVGKRRWAVSASTTKL